MPTVRASEHAATETRARRLRLEMRGDLDKFGENQLKQQMKQQQQHLKKQKQ